MKIIEQRTRQLLSQAYILGGSPCSGKSSIAARLSSEFNLPYYNVDEHEKEHSKRAHPSRHPTMYKFSKMNWSEVWMRPVPDQIQDEFEYYRERFEMIIQDLEEYAPEKAILLEGAAYLPELLEQNKANSNTVIFLVPTKEFQLHYYSQRPWIKDILKECDDPQRAFANWMMRDHLFGQEILRQAKARNYKTILVDGSRSIDQQYEIVKECFGLK